MKLFLIALAFPFVACSHWDDDCTPHSTDPWCYEDRTYITYQTLYSPMHIPYMVPTMHTEHVHITKEYRTNTVKTSRTNRSGKTVTQSGSRAKFSRSSNSGSSRPSSGSRRGTFGRAGGGRIGGRR